MRINLKIGTKISLGFATILLMLFIFGITSIVALYATKTGLEEINRASKRTDMSMQIDKEYIGIIAAVRGYLAYGDEKYSTQVNEGFTKISQMEEHLLGIAREDKKADVQKLISDTEKYKVLITNKLMPAVKEQQKATLAGDLQRAQALKEQSTGIAREIVPYAESISKFLSTAAEDNKAVMGKNLTMALDTATSVIYTAIGACILALLIGISISIYLTRMILNPIRKMLEGTNAYASGDLSSPIYITSSDELGELAKSLNVMKDNLKLVIGQIIASSEQVAASSEQLTAGAEQSAQAANQVAVSITDVATGAAAQLEAVSETTNTVEQMSAGIQQISGNATIVASTAEKAASAASEGGRAVEQATNQMVSIENAVIGSAKVVAKLGERSKEIGQIVDTISGIAGQTNLLALNAAIEAARAGEQGRGFAVVAEEVRKLAEQSQEAAKKIAELISEIQDDTDKAVTAMSEGTQEVKRGTEVVNTAGKTFGEIKSLVEQVSGQVRDISTAIETMASGSQNVVDAVKKIDKISAEAVDQTQTVSAATQEQSASMEEIASSSQALAKMAEELQAVVSKFKI